MCMGLSKSRYTKGIQCPKMLWMDLHMRDKFDSSVMNQAVLETGNKVGDVAMGYYGDFVEVPFDPSDWSGMIRETRELMRVGTPVICEATFSHDGSLCMVDILRVEVDGVHIVEVKSSTHINDIYYHDMAYQAWVLDGCGINVKSVSLMHLNNRYVREGDLDLSRLFEIEDCSDVVFSMQESVGDTVSRLKSYAIQQNEPDMPIGAQCKSPYECGYRGWCWKCVPKPSVFDLNGMQLKKALALYADGIETLGKVSAAGLRLNARQSVQVESETNDLDIVVDREAVRRFLDSLSSPCISWTSRPSNRRFLHSTG